MQLSLLAVLLVGCCLVDMTVSHSPYYGPDDAFTSAYVNENCQQETYNYNMTRVFIESWDLKIGMWNKTTSAVNEDVNDAIIKFISSLEAKPSGKSGSRKGRNKRAAHSDEHGDGHGDGDDRRVRKEYRSLTEEERTAYHNAVNALKTSMVTIGMSEFESFAMLHNFVVAPGAHGTPAFLPWHRHYIFLYEEALRSKDPTVTLPYWDSTIDAGLTNPSTSIMWTPEYMGNAVGGVVRTGPFKTGTAADWNVQRKCNFNPVLLYNNGVIDYLMGFKDYTSFFKPMEDHHNGPHSYIDGSLGAIETSPQDPLFYMHHAFVDSLWEEWRDNVQTLDPQFDYPEKTNTSNINFLYKPLVPWEETIHHGLGNYYAQFIKYAPRKSKNCKGCCDGRSTPNGNYNTKSAEPVYPAAPLPTNTNVYFRLRVDYQGRNPNLRPDYRPYNPYNPNGSPSHADQGKGCCGGTDYVYAECQGSTYERFSRDYTSFDGRLPVSRGYTYLSMPHPTSGFGECQLRVYTPFGRPCTPLCLVPNSNPPNYTPCCGVLNLENDNVKHYDTYADAIKGDDGFNFNAASPYPIYYDRASQFDSMIFYCENDNPMARVMPHK